MTMKRQILSFQLKSSGPSALFSLEMSIFVSDEWSKFSDWPEPRSATIVILESGESVRLASEVQNCQLVMAPNVLELFSKADCWVVAISG